MAGGGRYPQELIEKIRAATNIVDIVGEHVSLRKSGSNYSGLCPFHSERTPSFNVQEAKQFYHCFGCKRSGDVFDFIEEMHGIGFAEAIEELADRARIPLPKSVTRGGGTGDAEAEARRDAQREKLSTAWRLNRFASVFYQQNLAKFPAADAYIRQRGVSADSLRNFFVGAALPSWDALAKHLIAAKAPLDLAVELGLVSPSTKGAPGGPGYFDLFRNRAVFPIHDLRGKVVAFGGRALPDSDSGGDSGPKYLNSRESFLFKKSEIAYGLFQAQKHVREHDEIIIVEGYFDVIALHTAGFQNVVATCGTSLTAKHLELFKRFASRIVILFDGDKAGVAATDKAMELGLAHGMVLHGARMPEGLDPDEILFSSTGNLLADGKERMAAILKSASPMIDARIAEAAQQAASSAEDRTLAIKRVAAWLAQYTDPVGKAVRLQEAEKALGVPAEVLVPRSRPAQPRSAPSPTSAVQLRRPPVARVDAGGAKRPPAPLAPAERVLLMGLARGGKALELAEKARYKLPDGVVFSEIFSHPSACELLQAAEKKGSLALGSEILSASLPHPIDPQVQSTLTEAWMSQESPFSLQDFQVALDRALGRAWARFSHRIIVALKEAEAKKDAGLHSKLMKDYLDVQRKMKEFNTFYDEA
ncbi:MAG: DNA primase [Oligoflexia bacterium]|nr:DNA primase [Oligoflexia bacterium]